MKKRIVYIDSLKLFAMWLVLYGHCTQHLITSSPYNDPCYYRVYSFHMPLFMILSGFFAYGSFTKYPFLDYIKRRFFQLVLPCISWAIIISFIYYFLLGKRCSFFDVFFSQFWFLKSAFVCCVTAAFCYNCENKKLMFFVTLLLTQFIPNSVIAVSTMYPCFVFGMILNRKWEIFEIHYRKVFLYSLTFFIIMHFYYNGSFLTGKQGMISELIHGNGRPIIEYFLKRTYNLIIGIWGSMTFISFFRSLEGYSFLSGGGKMSIGQYTIGVYILQVLVLEILMKEWLCFDKYNYYLSHFVFFPIISTTLLFSLSYITKWITRNKIAGFFLFGKIS